MNTNYFDQFPTFPERQDSSSDQLYDLAMIAYRAGLDDAGDAINQAFHPVTSNKNTNHGYFNKFPIMVHREDSVYDQLLDLVTIGNRAGLKDAASALTRLLKTSDYCTTKDDALSKKLEMLVVNADSIGINDTVFAIRELFNANGHTEVKYGCHCDLEEGMEPDECVIDDANYHLCIYANADMVKEQCEYWQQIK